MTNDKPKIGLNIAVIGGMGSGKTFEIKKRIKQLGGSAFIYDPNEEYIDEVRNLYRGKMRVKDFAETVNEKSFNSINVFEEATAFIRHGAPDENIIDLLTRKRHKRVINFFVFHSLNAMPAYIYSYLNVMILFKTADRSDLVFNKYKENKPVLVAFEKVKTAPKYKPQILKIS